MLKASKLCVQVAVDSIYLPIEINYQLLLALKNLIKHSFYLAFLSLCLWILVRRTSISFVFVVVVVGLDVGFLVL